MGLFDGGDSAKNNARKGAKAVKQGAKKARKKDIKKAVKKSVTALTAAKDEGTAALERAETKGIEATDTGYGRAREDLGAGKVEGIGYIDQGKTEALGKYQDALDLYKPLMDQANAGATAYGNFYGLGGTPGYDKAKADWKNSVQFDAMAGDASLGIQALNRQAAGRGNPYNATDVGDYYTTLANRHVNDYISGLRPYLDQQGNLVGQQANIYGNMANTISGAAGQMGNYAYGTGQDLGQLGYNTGVQQSGVYTGTGGRLAGLAQDIGTTKATGVYMPGGRDSANLRMQGAGAESDMYANITAAKNAANQNKWGAINAGLGALGSLAGAAFK